MRTYRKTHRSLIDNLIRPTDADVFVHTWDTAGNTNKLILFLPAGFHLKLPQSYFHAPPDLLSGQTCAFERAMPNLYRELQTIASADESVTVAEIDELYHPVDRVVEAFDPGMFDRYLNIPELKNLHADPAALNAVPMFYKIAACDLLRRKHERLFHTTYDLVIRTRPDMRFFAPVRLTAEHAAGKLLTLRNPNYELLGVTDALSNDMFFVGDSETMTYTADLWSELPGYWNPTEFPDWPFHHRGPERVLNYHLRRRGLGGETLTLDPPPARDVPAVNFPRMLDLLHMDHDQPGGLPAFIPVCVALCQSKHAIDLFQSGRKEEAEHLLASPVVLGDLVCEEPYVGRAKLASIRQDANLPELVALARSSGQDVMFKELFSE
jgi:hypothetical protein